MIVSMTGIVKRYARHTALDHLTMEVRKGEVLGLLGPNGAGKTTAIRVLTGLTAADAGKTALFGQEMRARAAEIKRRIGVVPQDLALYETLPARENLWYFGKLYGMGGAQLKSRTDEVLEVLGLTEVAKKPPKKFSGGMKRRLNIGCAVMHRPELLILDEPTVGIDPQSRSHILDFVTEMNAQGTTVLYTSHYMEEVERICSRVLIVDAGRVIADGSVAELTRTVLFEETVVIEVKNPAPSLPDSIKNIQGVLRCDTDGHILTVTSTAGSANLARMLECAAPFVILGVTGKRPTLEDAFLALTGKKLRDGGEGE
ncbi:MAG: ABC transporter ATP-binding protein [Oscillospiraceae bacterium]|jgi:ABC-2 type transport system ATP-binding protein|nr:ABC transporter ATP-binding protein [Oscillospiraceae bacterium]